MELQWADWMGFQRGNYIWVMSAAGDVHLHTSWQQNSFPKGMFLSGKDAVYLLVNYVVIISYLLCLNHFYGISYFNWHIANNQRCSNNHKLYRLCNFQAIMMGGDIVKIEPNSMKEFKQDPIVWHIIHEGEVVPFLEEMMGHDKNLSCQFAESWDDVAR